MTDTSSAWSDAVSSDVPPDATVAAVVRAVADAEGVSLVDLDPIATVIDPDALDRAVQSLDPTTGDTMGTVAFTYCGYEVTVAADCSVSLAETSSED